MYENKKKYARLLFERVTCKNNIIIGFKERQMQTVQVT